MSNEYAVTEDDLKGGGGGSTAKPRGTYTGTISKAESKKDKNGKVYLGFGVSITLGKYKNGLIFENYLTLDPNANGFAIARRNSFYKAIALKPGMIPYGVPSINGSPAGPDVALLNGTTVDVTIEHRFENVPGEDYNVVTSKSKKSNWVLQGWSDDCINAKGQLFRNPGGDIFDAPVDPREEVTFYNLSDEFEGVGGGSADPADEGVDEGWGG